MDSELTNSEEGARFPKSLHGSSVWSGDFTVENAHALTDVADSSITAGAELERIGYKGTLECSAKANPLAAHFELHIGKSWVTLLDVGKLLTNQSRDPSWKTTNKPLASSTVVKRTSGSTSVSTAVTPMLVLPR